MGKIDIVDRPYFSDHERFAELMNVALYHGERVMTYDACEYEYQMREIGQRHKNRSNYQSYREKKSRIKESDFLLPTVTVVLYLKEGRWEGRRCLSQMFHMSARSREMLGSALQDYDFPLIEADFADPQSYNTDLKEFFRAMQCRKDREKLRKLFQTKEFQRLCPETELVIARHLHIKSLINKMEKEELPMCKAFDDLMKEERREGKREGRREGKREERLRIIRQMAKEGLDETSISRITKCTREELAAAGL